jgi:hypothetical protein
MTKLLYVRNGNTIELDAKEIFLLLRESYIRSVYSSDKSISLKTSDHIEVRIESAAEPTVTFKDYGAVDGPFPVNILGDAEQTAVEIEDRIHALRQLYATVYLVEAGRAKEITEEVEKFDIDIESKFLSEDEKLHLYNVTTGSFSALLGSLSELGSKVIDIILGAVLPGGKEQLFRQLRASTESAEADAERKRLENEGIELDNLQKRIEAAERYGTALVKFGAKVQGIEDSALKERITRLFDANLHAIGAETPKDFNVKVERAKAEKDTKK